MSTLLLLSNSMQPSAEVLPALGLLLHNVRVAPAEVKLPEGGVVEVLPPFAGG